MLTEVKPIQINVSSSKCYHHEFLRVSYFYLIYFYKHSNSPPFHTIVHSPNIVPFHFCSLFISIIFQFEQKSWSINYVWLSHVFICSATWWELCCKSLVWRSVLSRWFIHLNWFVDSTLPSFVSMRLHRPMALIKKKISLWPHGDLSGVIGSIHWQETR